MIENEDKPEKIEIPKKAIYRLSLYRRGLQKLKGNDQTTVSSTDLARIAGVKPSQLRRDLGYFGQFGIRGLGYPIDSLLAIIRVALGREELQPVILVGAGNLGSALLRYPGFQKGGFEVIAAFDSSPDAARASELKIPVHHSSGMKDFIKGNQVKVAIVCVPVVAVQEVVNDLVASGIQGILNFSSVVLEVPPEVTVNNVDLALELEHLGYFIK